MGLCAVYTRSAMGCFQEPSLQNGCFILLYLYKIWQCQIIFWEIRSSKEGRVVAVRAAVLMSPMPLMHLAVQGSLAQEMLGCRGRSSVSVPMTAIFVHALQTLLGAFVLSFSFTFWRPSLSATLYP